MSPPTSRVRSVTGFFANNSSNSIASLDAASKGLYEPSHGSAPKYTGMYKVNPIATILAAKMMLTWLGETEKADKVERAVAAIIKEGQVRTYDMGGSNTTMEMAQAVARRCRS